MLFEPEYVIYVDGASRGNPGHASYGYAILDSEGRVIHSGSGYIGVNTNNVAEYTALQEALRFALKQGIASVEVRADSELMVRQIKGEYKVRAPHLMPIYEECRSLLRKLQVQGIEHVPREQNRIADRLANEALDRKLKKQKTLKSDQ